MEAFASYLETIPPDKRERREIFYDVKDVVGRSGFGIGSAGPGRVQPADRGPRPGARERRDPDDEAGQRRRPRAASSTTRVRDYFEHEGHRTVDQPARAAAAHRPAARLHDASTASASSSPTSPPTRRTSTGPRSPSRRRSARLSPTSAAPRRRSTASRTPTATKAWSSSPPRRRSPPCSTARRTRSSTTSSDFGIEYAQRARRDHELFVDAFRGGRFDLVSAT